MKKTIKIFAVLTILIASLMMLTACGEQKTESKKEENTATNSASQTENKTSQTEKFIDKNESYFFIYNGVKINAGDKISSLSTAGLSVRDVHRDVEVKSKDRRSCEITNLENKSIFNLTAYNKESAASKLSDTWVGGVTISTVGAERDSKVAQMEVYGGIKLGSTVEELKKVFGEPDKSSTEKEYVYESKVVSRYFRFDIKDGKVSGITWMNRAF